MRGIKPLNIERTNKMNQLCVPIPAASDTQQILDEVFSMCRIPWIYDFIFYGDPAADISMLLAPVQKRHGLAARIFVNATETSSKYAHTFDFNKELVFYSLPAFSVGPITAGFCVEQPVTRTTIVPVHHKSNKDRKDNDIIGDGSFDNNDASHDLHANSKPAVSIQQLETSVESQIVAPPTTRTTSTATPTTKTATGGRKKSSTNHVRGQQQQQHPRRHYDDQTKSSSSPSSSSSSSDMLQCIRFVRHDDNGVFFHVAENHLTGVTQVDCLTLHSSTRLKRVRMKFDLHSLRSVLRTPRGILHPPDIASSLIYLNVSHERRLCPVCEGRIASTECDCILPLQRPAHPLDFRFEASNMRLYTGFYQGATVVRLCSAGHCVINATLQSGSVIQGEMNHSLVDKLHRLAVRDRISRLKQNIPKHHDLSVSSLINEAQQIVNNLEQHARTYDRESQQQQKNRKREKITQLDVFDDCELDEDILADNDDVEVDACLVDQPHATTKRRGTTSTGPATHQELQETHPEELPLISASTTDVPGAIASVLPSTSQHKSSFRLNLHSSVSVPSSSLPNPKSSSSSQSPLLRSPSSLSLHLRRPYLPPALALSEGPEPDNVNDNDTPGTTCADKLPALNVENAAVDVGAAAANGRLVALTGQERDRDSAEVASIDLDDVDGLMDAKEVLGEMDKEDMINHEGHDSTQAAALHVSSVSGNDNDTKDITFLSFLGIATGEEHSQSRRGSFVTATATPKRVRKQLQDNHIGNSDNKNSNLASSPLTAEHDVGIGVGIFNGLNDDEYEQGHDLDDVDVDVDVDVIGDGDGDGDYDITSIPAGGGAYQYKKPTNTQAGQDEEEEEQQEQQQEQQQQRKRKRNGYEGLTEEEKMEIRKKRNREAAARSNLKRKLRNESVRRDLASLTQKAVRLRVKEMMLRDENTRLRNALKAANIQSNPCNNNKRITPYG